VEGIGFSNVAYGEAFLGALLGSLFTAGPTGISTAFPSLIRKIIMLFQLFTAWMLLGLAPRLAFASPYRCEMKWNLISEGESAQEFALNGRTELSPFPHWKVTIEKGESASKVEVVQSYGAHDANHVRYSLECAGQCQGLREELAGGKKKSTPFWMRPTPAAIAAIGKRDVFEYHASPKGFSYRFEQYRKPSGEPAGMQLDCRE
jgi:hypothetical protein